jgi:hypothetical protein
VRSITHAEWLEEGRRLYGADAKTWAFVCPSCGQRQTIGEMIRAGMPESMFAFSCIGRGLGSSTTMGEPSLGRGCNYAGGGLFKLNPVRVVFDGSTRETFEWADAQDAAPAPETNTADASPADTAREGHTQ